MKTGFFTMETVNQILSFSTLEESKKFLHDLVKETKNARVENVTKATAMIDKCKTQRDLALSVSNFVLAHPSENLRILK